MNNEALNNKQSKYNNIVDLIKFVAAIMVIFSHSFSLSNNSEDFLTRLISNASFGSFAVAIFFSFSGYYITRSILKNDKLFLLRRIKRIIPELFVVIFFTVLIVGPVFTNLSLVDYFSKKGTYLYFLNILLIPYHNLPGVFINNIYGSTVNGALWTLSVELFCYIYIYIINKIGFLTKRRSLIIFLIVLLFSLFSYELLDYLDLKIIISVIRPFLVFSFSSLLYFYKDSIKKHSLIIIFLLSINCLVSRMDVFYNLFLIFLLTLILCYVSNNFVLKNKLFSKLGKISYPIYLVGFVVQQSIISIFGGSMNSYLNFCISVPMSIIIAVFINSITNKIMLVVNNKIKI